MIVMWSCTWRITSWLARPENVNRNPRIPFDSHQIRFHPSHNNSSTSTMAGISSAHSSFVSQESFQAQQVTCTNNCVHAGSAINLAEPYPTAYLVGIWVMVSLLTLLTRSLLAFSAMLARINLSRGGEQRPSPTSSMLEEQLLPSMSLGRSPLGVHVLGFRGTLCGVEEYSEWPSPIQSP